MNELLQVKDREISQVREQLRQLQLLQQVELDIWIYPMLLW